MPEFIEGRADDGWFLKKNATKSSTLSFEGEV
jgi:hypothetical protein